LPVIDIVARVSVTLSASDTVIPASAGTAPLPAVYASAALVVTTGRWFGAAATAMPRLATFDQDVPSETTSVTVRTAVSGAAALFV
jgi:hypothetical protein